MCVYDAMIGNGMLPACVCVMQYKVRRRLKDGVLQKTSSRTPRTLGELASWHMGSCGPSKLKPQPTTLIRHPSSALASLTSRWKRGTLRYDHDQMW